MHNYLLHKKKQTHFSPTDTWYDPTVHNAQAEAPAKINSMSISRGVCENQLGCHFYPSSLPFYVECISQLLWVLPLSFLTLEILNYEHLNGFHPGPYKNAQKSQVPFALKG